MSWLSELFSGGKNPADSAMPYLNEIPGVGHDYYDPYVNQGREAGDELNSLYEQLLKDPTGFMQKLQEGYKPSEQYQFNKEQLSNELYGNAAAGGYVGTNPHQQQLGKLVSGLLSQDEQQYLQNALGIFDKGLGGKKDIYDKGFTASGALADYLGSNLGQQANLKFQGQQQQNANRNSVFSSLAQGAGALAGGVLGGAPGAFIGGKLPNLLPSRSYG